MTPLKARIAAAKERADKATPGPWIRDGMSAAGGMIASFGGDAPPVCACGDVDMSDENGAENDAAFIAAARADVPYLADQLSRAVELLEKVHEYLDRNGPPDVRDAYEMAREIKALIDPEQP